MNTAHAAIKTAQAVVSVWPRYPVLYEINTWIWLTDLSQKYSRNIDLSSVPSSEWDAVAVHGFDAVWLMGVWERSPAGIAIANRNLGLLESFREALPDFQPADNVGSPYSIRRYEVDPHLGGPTGLATARKELFKRGINLILDFVPNHVAPDHPWACEHPEYFIQGNGDDIKNAPGCFIELQGSICACGRDPFFPPWPDVLQLNAFEAGLRKAVIETISTIALQCDGIRCDMGMLVLNSIFQRTWGSRAGQVPATEYWVDVISTIKVSTRASCLLLRLTGVSSGIFSKKDSTSAMTRNSTIGSSTALQKTSVSISAPISPFKTNCFVFWRTMTNHEPLLPFRRRSYRQPR